MASKWDPSSVHKSSWELGETKVIGESGRMEPINETGDKKTSVCFNVDGVISSHGSAKTTDKRSDLELSKGSEEGGINSNHFPSDLDGTISHHVV